ncbi:MAG: hypothetical protein FJ348_03145 [Sphingomonadales bacterium]|nr:hypothetical protein [Sphingomonadales bacterium]
MKFSIALLLTFLTGLGLGTTAFVPWWGFVVAAALVGATVHQTATKTFAAGFLGMLMAWGGLAWWIDWQNQSLLSQKIALVLPLGGSAAALLFITGTVGGLLAGLAALSGHYARASVQK